jgi:multiple sugar transport system substrate-binding protein
VDQRGALLVLAHAHDELVAGIGGLRLGPAREQLARARLLLLAPPCGRIATELRLVMEKVVRGNLPASAAPAELDARADRILEKRRWMLDRRALR